MMCSECPHKPYLATCQAIDVTYVTDKGEELTGIHPCHMCASVPCVGHETQERILAMGELLRSEDTLRFTLHTRSPTSDQ